jgi:hypothetical protein
MNCKLATYIAPNLYCGEVEKKTCESNLRLCTNGHIIYTTARDLGFVQVSLQKHFQDSQMNGNEYVARCLQNVPAVKPTEKSMFLTTSMT